MKIKKQFDTINLDTFIEDYLAFKGIKDVSQYLNPTPHMVELEANYKHMQEAYECYEKHMMNGDKFGLLVDSDLDGMFSSTLFHNHTKEVNPNIEIQVFFHDAKQHGLDDKTVFKQILDSDIDVLVIPDASSGDLDELRLLKDLEKIGWKPLDVIILDHHPIPKGRSVEEYAHVVNNKISDNVINKEVCGTVVTWHFCRYVDYINGFDYSDKYIDICACATVADVQDVREIENRVLCYYGFSNITNTLLLSTIREFGKCGNDVSNIYDWGWNCNPKLNGIIRSGVLEDIQHLFLALTNPDAVVQWQRIKKEGIREWNVVDKILALGKSASSSKSSTVKKAVDKVMPTIDTERKVVLIENDGSIPKTLGGDVANKIQSALGKPCLVFMDIEDDETCFGGSCRSPVPVKKLMQKSGLFEFAEGHDHAFGYRIKKENMAKLQEYCDTLNLSTEMTHEVISQFTPSTIPKPLFELIESHLELFGKGLENPTFAFNFKINSSDIQCYPTVCRMLVDGVTFIKFFPTKKFKEDFHLEESQKLDITIVGNLGVNEYNGYRNPQVIIQDYLVKIDKSSKYKSIDELF